MQSNNTHATNDRRESNANTSGVHALSLDTPQKGTQSSNTVPSNYNSDSSCLILRCAIDSLYLSYRGEMLDDAAIRLKKHKELARSDFAVKQCLAQIELNDHLLEVAGNGRNPYAFILGDNWFRIEVAKQGAKTVPLAYCKIASECLTTCGY